MFFFIPSAVDHDFTVYAIGPDVSTLTSNIKTRRQKKVANFADAFTLMCSLGPKPSLKIRTASAIFWNYLGIFRNYGLKYIFFRNKTFFLFFKIES